MYIEQSCPQYDEVNWIDWLPLRNSWIGDRIPAMPGLYRIRRAGRDDLDYIGQTGMGGMTLRKRLAMLAGIYEPEMPYRDPHTAGPALWALRQMTKCEYEVSVMPITTTTPCRKGLECIAIALYRQEHHHSPTVQFGRMPVGYRMSSGNNRHLAEAGKRFRGGATDDEDESHLSSLPPAGPLAGDLQGASWCGHSWSMWAPVDRVASLLGPDDQGLYRIRQPGHMGLLYIGEGRARQRLLSHLAKTSNERKPQAQVFTPDMECSWVLNPVWRKHERLELENDLIAAYVFSTHTIPPAQFVG